MAGRLKVAVAPLTPIHEGRGSRKHGRAPDCAHARAACRRCAADGVPELALTTLLPTPPRNPVLFPLQGVMVGILPWDAVLASDEKVGRLRSPAFRPR